MKKLTKKGKVMKTYPQLEDFYRVLIEINGREKVIEQINLTIKAFEMSGWNLAAQHYTEIKNGL